jgi:glycosyltransferase involved in cell wall biosynthesis
MAMERPVITTDTAGCRETVDDGVNGYLVGVKDAKALADAMERFLRLDATARAAMGTAGREKALREFDDRLIAGQYLDLIRASLS